MQQQCFVEHYPHSTVNMACNYLINDRPSAAEASAGLMSNTLLKSTFASLFLPSL
jgi:hypothetical protein